MNNNIKNKIRINRLKEDNNILKKCQIKYNYFGRDHQNITMKGTKKYKNENGEYYLKNRKKEEKIILNTNKKSSNTNNLPNDKINSNGKSKNNNYNANNQFIKVKKKKLFKDELTPIPDVKPKNKISTEHEKKYVSKAIVHTKYSRRYQYSNNIEQKHLERQREIKQCEKIFLENIKYIQIWWKTIFQIIKLQKHIRGFIFRLKLLDSLEKKEIYADKIISLMKSIKKILFKRFVNNTNIFKEYLKHYFYKWNEITMKKFILKRLIYYASSNKIFSEFNKRIMITERKMQLDSFIDLDFIPNLNNTNSKIKIKKENKESQIKKNKTLYSIYNKNKEKKYLTKISFFQSTVQNIKKHKLKESKKNKNSSLIISCSSLNQKSKNNPSTSHILQNKDKNEDFKQYNTLKRQKNKKTKSNNNNLKNNRINNNNNNVDICNKIEQNSDNNQKENNEIKIFNTITNFNKPNNRSFIESYNFPNKNKNNNINKNLSKSLIYISDNENMEKELIMNSIKQSLKSNNNLITKESYINSYVHHNNYITERYIDNNSISVSTLKNYHRTKNKVYENKLKEKNNSINIASNDFTANTVFASPERSQIESNWNIFTDNREIKKEQNKNIRSNSCINGNSFSITKNESIHYYKENKSNNKEIMKIYFEHWVKITKINIFLGVLRFINHIIKFYDKIQLFSYKKYFYVFQNNIINNSFKNLFVFINENKNELYKNNIIKEIKNYILLKYFNQYKENIFSSYILQNLINYQKNKLFINNHKTKYIKKRNKNRFINTNYEYVNCFTENSITNNENNFAINNLNNTIISERSSKSNFTIYNTNNRTISASSRGVILSKIIEFPRKINKSPPPKKNPIKMLYIPNKPQAITINNKKAVNKSMIEIDFSCSLKYAESNNKTITKGLNKSVIVEGNEENEKLLKKDIVTQNNQLTMAINIIEQKRILKNNEFILNIFKKWKNISNNLINYNENELSIDNESRKHRNLSNEKGITFSGLQPTATKGTTDNEEITQYTLNNDIFQSESELGGTKSENNSALNNPVNNFNLTKMNNTNNIKHIVQAYTKPISQKEKINIKNNNQNNKKNQENNEDEKNSDVNSTLSNIFCLIDSNQNNNTINISNKISKNVYIKKTIGLSSNNLIKNKSKHLFISNNTSYINTNKNNGLENTKTFSTLEPLELFDYDYDYIPNNSIISNKSIPKEINKSISNILNQNQSNILFKSINTEELFPLKKINRIEEKEITFTPFIKTKQKQFIEEIELNKNMNVNKTIEKNDDKKLEILNSIKEEQGIEKEKDTIIEEIDESNNNYNDINNDVINLSENNSEKKKNRNIKNIRKEMNDMLGSFSILKENNSVDILNKSNKKNKIVEDPNLTI